MSKNIGVYSVALPPWKKKRRAIVKELIKTNFYDYEGFQMPSNRIRSHVLFYSSHFQKRQLKTESLENQENFLFDDFITLCHGSNTSTIQCEIDENDVLHFVTSPGTDENLERWLIKCFVMVKNLFELESSVSRLRSDITRGPVVFTFCSVIIKYLRKTFYPALLELRTLQKKNLLTLQRKCAEFNEILQPLKEVALEIEKYDFVGGELINILCNASQKDDRFRIADLLKKIISLTLKRYCEIIYEWTSQCTLTFDLAHEFFIWDLSKVRCVKRQEFPSNLSDGTAFDKRFVLIPELCPEIFKSVCSKIVETGKYLYTMQMQKGDLNLLTPQLFLDVEMFRNRPVSELKTLIREAYDKCSLSIMHHLINKFDIENFALRLPNYFMGLNSVWIEELVVLYEESQFFELSTQNISSSLLRQLLTKALENDWLKDDVFHDKFEIQISPFYKIIDDIPALELHINWDLSLQLVFSRQIQELYKTLFRLAFNLQRTRYLLYKKRFFKPNYAPSRVELATIFLMIRFVNTYQNFVFVTVGETTYKKFENKFCEVENLDDLVEMQFKFLCSIFNDACLDHEKLKLSTAINNLIVLFGEFAGEKINFNELTIRASSLINFIKKFFLQNNSCLLLRNILFGSNFHCIGDADKEPLWLSLRHIEPIN